MTHHLPTTWRKSSYSLDSNNCVELAATPAAAVLVRDSKNPEDGHLAFALAELAAFVDACTVGQLDSWQ